ncbi:aminotransferase class IV [Streptomyces caniferus]|uniref:aminotransferase class IV n=1 Tax=Streptomyces caniferus TaxID=285557 RepID=UPI00380A584D
MNGHPADPDALRTLALTNYGHFTSMRVDDQRVRGLSRHLDRQVRDCRTVFGADLDPALVRRYVREAVGDEPGAFVVRVTVLDPGLDIGHPADAQDPHVLVTHRPAGALPLPPLRVKTVRYQRDVSGNVTPAPSHRSPSATSPASRRHSPPTPPSAYGPSAPSTTSTCPPITPPSSASAHRSWPCPASGCRARRPAGSPRATGRRRRGG